MQTFFNLACIYNKMKDLNLCRACSKPRSIRYTKQQWISMETANDSVKKAFSHKHCFLLRCDTLYCVRKVPQSGRALVEVHPATQNHTPEDKGHYYWNLKPCPFTHHIQRYMPITKNMMDRQTWPCYLGFHAAFCEKLHTARHLWTL
jgi:hypothetical protein